MTNITKKEDQALSTLANAFANAGAQLGGTALEILKLTKSGEWVAGADNTAVTERRFAADVKNARRGYVCFVDGQVVDEVWVPVATGKTVAKEDLPDQGPFEGNDGWVESVAIQLRSLESGADYIFKPTSHGGRAAVGGLLTAYGHRLELGKSGVPIIEIGAGSYEHKRYGKVFKPIFRIVDWRAESELLTQVGETPPISDDEIPF
jgi:hypothetical protein